MLPDIFMRYIYIQRTSERNCRNSGFGGGFDFIHEGVSRAFPRPRPVGDDCMCDHQYSPNFDSTLVVTSHSEWHGGG